MANEFLQNIFNATQGIREKQRIQEQKNRDNLLAFFGGVADNYHAYAGGINKGLGKVAKKVGWDSGAKWFNENATLSQLNRQRTQDAMGYGSNPYIGMAGQILGDPINVLPAGTIVNGGKTGLKTAKSFGLGAGLGASTSMLRDYNDDSVSKADMFKNAMLGGVMWGGANSLLASRAVDTLARKAVGKIAPNAKFADINARNARWAREQAQINANPTAWYNREVAVPFAQDFRNIRNAFTKPQQTTGNQVLDSVLAMTNQPKPQTFSQSIATRPLMGENPINISPQHAQAKAREALDNQYNQMLMSKLPQQDPYYLSPNRPQPNTARPMMPQQPINNPNLANPNMKAGFTTSAIPNLLANTAYYGGAGAIGAYNSDNPYLGFAGGVATAYGLKHGGKRTINTFKNRPLGDTKNAFNNGYVNLSYETRMSDKSPAFKNAYNMLGDRKTAEQFDIAVHSDKDVKKIMDNLGLRYKDIGIKDGMYEGISNPSRQLQIKPEFDGNGNLTQDFINRVNLASAMLGKGFKQDAVAWHLPKKLDLEKATPEQLRSANGLKLSLDEPINAEVLGKFDKAFGSRYGLIPDPDGKSVRIIDFETEIDGKAKDFTNFPNDVRNLLKQSGYNTRNLKGERFTIANGDYIGNNHKVLKSQTNGEKDILFYDRKGYDDTINNLSSNIYSTDNSVGNIFGKIAKAKKRFTETIDGATPTTDRWVLPTSQQMERNFGRRERELVERQTRNSTGLAQGQGSVVRTGQDLRRVVGDLSPQQSQTQQSLQGILPQDGRGFGKGFIAPNLAKGKALNGDAIDDIVNKRTKQTPQSIQNRPLMGEMAEQNAHLNQIREIFDKQNTKANLGKDFASDINAVEQGLITPDEFINAWKKPSVADDIPHNGGGNGGDIPPNTPKGGGFADDGGNEFAKQIGLENLSDNDLKKAFADTPNNNNSVKGFITKTLAKDAIMASGGATYGAYNAEEGEKLQGAVGGALGGIALAHPFKTLQLGGKVASKTADTIGNVPGVKQAIQAYDKNVAKATNKADDYWRAFWAKTSDKVRAESNQRFQNMSISEIAKEAQANFKRQNPNVSDDAGMRFATSYAENMVRKDFADISRHIVDDSMSVGQQVKETAYNVSQWFKETLSDTKGASFNVAYDKFIGSKNGFSQKMASLQDTLLKMSESDRTALHNYLVGESEALGTKLPEKYKFMADGIRQSIDDMSDKLVKEGLIDEAVANELKGQYIHRLYDSVGEKAKDTIAKNTNTLEKMHHRGKLVETISKKEWQERLKNSDYNDLFKADFNKGGLRAIEKNGKMEIYRDFTPQERTAMKEIRDAAHTIPQTLMYMNTLAENARFLKELANLGNGEIMTADMIRKHFGMETANIAKLGEKAKMPKLELNEAQIKELKRLGYEKVATDPKWGALSGQWVRRDMFDALKGSRFFNMDELGLLGKLWLHGTSFWKKSKTIFSQTAHINNVLSNVSLMHLAGVSKRDITRGYAFGSEAIGAIKRYDEIVAKNRIGKATMSEINELQALNQNEYVKTILQGRQVGLFGRSMLHDINNGIIQPNLQVAKGKGIGGKIKQGWNSVDKWASDLYQDEDNLGRIVMFKHFMDKGMSPQQAKIATQAYIPDYSRVMPKGQRFLRDKMIAPFMSWSYYVMPTMAKYIAKHPAQASSKILPLLALAGTAQYALSGINPLKADVIGDDNLKPNEFQGRKLAVGRDGDRIRGYELSRIVPYLNVINPQTWAEYGKGLMSGPTTQAVYNASNMLAGEPLKQFYNGRPVTYQNKSDFDQMKDYMGYGVKTYAPIPQVATNAVDLANSLIFPKERRRTSSVIEPKTANEFIAKFAGFNTTSYNIDRLRRENAKKKQQEREKELKKLRSK